MALAKLYLHQEADAKAGLPLLRTPPPIQRSFPVAIEALQSPTMLTSIAMNCAVILGGGQQTEVPLQFRALGLCLFSGGPLQHHMKLLFVVLEGDEESQPLVEILQAAEVGAPAMFPERVLRHAQPLPCSQLKQ